MKVAHPVGKQRIAFHFFFCNIAGSERTAAVGQKDVVIASVIADVKNRGIFGYIFFTNDSDIDSGYPKEKTEYSLNEAKGTYVLGHGSKFADDPFHNENGDGQNKKSDDKDAGKNKTDHINFLSVMIFLIFIIRNFKNSCNKSFWFHIQ